MAENPMICVLCPKGCDLTTDGHCPKGEAFRLQESQDPRRVVLTSVLVQGGVRPITSVKSSRPVPLPMIRPIIEELNRHAVQAPVEMGQVLFPGILGTKADIIATRPVKKAGAANAPSRRY
jgi:CxxC motif-containing protein